MHSALNRVIALLTVRNSSRFAALPSTVVLLACVGARPALQPEPCLTDRYVFVRNQIGTEVEVYQHSERGATPRLVGTARPGPSEFLLPAGGLERFQARFPGGQWIAPAFGNQRVAERITFEVKCR